jgi:hypothetical protein
MGVTINGGNGWGGRRIGAGRKPGEPNKNSRAMVEEARDAGLEMPLPRLLRRMNDKSLPEATRDQLASLAAPFCHPRLSAVSLTKRPAEMTDEEIAQLIGLTAEDMLRLGIGRDRWPHPVH